MIFNYLERIKMILIKRLITALVMMMPLSVLASQIENVNDNKWGLNLPKGVTPFSQDIYDLHMIVLIIVTIILLLVKEMTVKTVIKQRCDSQILPQMTIFSILTCSSL